ncbi:SIS domain-containing protein [Thalassospira sp.]|uniref:KpsF/GutQ family sugar-phosphate isomerase n=1 Tax=Thalassospira sp. TaxID=1912094 RepID=UPI0027356BA3|nr:KpsF/GutQ family sugar-phosphate isomerase [Thalassospira sp.]MDP2699195.1 KpsF/GutQ family sugar-phosphate isomerase [Thalassospira sp.]
MTVIVADSQKDLAVARNVLAIEANALRELAESLNGDFCRAITLIEGLKGRLVITGMGKSGHIAKKIAATFASTGTPSFFVHPAEASHGDLGMIGRDDAVLALSNSGETPELSDIIAYTRRFQVPLICMTRKAGSSLARQSDCPLVLPASPEACPNRQAPTTSTTAMLALGDALAVALMERRGFSADDFRTFHPGGKLGQRLLRVSDVMHGRDDIPLISGDAVMGDALMVMTGKSFGCVGVLADDGKMTGIVTDGDLRRHMSDNLVAQKVSDVMTANPRTIGVDLLAVEALAVMNDRSITALFVLDDAGMPVGLVHIHDLLRLGVA